jgi:hypothetical protein
MAVVEQQMSSLAQPAPTHKEDEGDWEQELGLKETPPKDTPPKDAPPAGVTPPKEPVPDDHPTKLGRRVKQMEELLSGFSEKFDTFLSKLDETPRRASAPQSVEDEDVPEHIRETVDYIEKRRSKREQQEFDRRQKYATAYLKAVRGTKEEDVDEELHNEVVKELTETNYQSYLAHTNDPLQDAKINYDLGLATILKRQRAGKKAAPNVRGDRANAPTDISSGTHMSGPPPKRVELDEFSKKYLASLGAKEDDEWVVKSLQGSRQ